MIITRHRVLAVSPSPIPSFARQDAELLSSSFEVDVEGIRGFGSIRQLNESIGQADALLVWFLGRNAMLPMLLARMRRIPVVAVIGGFEVAWVKNLNYGIPPGSLKDIILNRLIRASHFTLTVSEFSHREALSRFPDLAHKLILVPNAVDTSRFVPLTNSARSGVVSIGAINAKTIERKSLRLFVETARRMPRETFTLIGPATDTVGNDFVNAIPENVVWPGPLGGDELVSRLQGASVYFQASVYESFCVALAEAMSCGCFPVISNLAALPEVAGETATVLQSLTAESAETAIRIALQRPDSDRPEIRRRIVDNFGIVRRRSLLTSMLEEAIANTRL